MVGSDTRALSSNVADVEGESEAALGRTQDEAHLMCIEDEDASSGVTGRHERAKRYCVRPGDYVSVDYQDQLCREVR
ncbi:MAG: hypothetical protein V3U39_05710 [Acidimicrobiia bacterium]